MFTLHMQRSWYTRNEAYPQKARLLTSIPTIHICIHVVLRVQCIPYCVMHPGLTYWRGVERTIGTCLMTIPGKVYKHTHMCTCTLHTECGLAAIHECICSFMWNGLCGARIHDVRAPFLGNTSCVRIHNNNQTRRKLTTYCYYNPARYSLCIRVCIGVTPGVIYYPHNT